MATDLEIKLEFLFPTGKNMMVEPIQDTAQTKSGIILNVGSQGATPVWGKVLKSGPDSTIPAGTVIFFKRYSVDEITITDSTGQKKICTVEDDDVIYTYQPK